MVGQGRESQKDNALFFTCGLIDYISRKTKNVRADVVNRLGKDNIRKIYSLADVYHCDNIDSVSDDFIGKVYRRLIKMVAADEQIDVIDALIEVYNSFISPMIDDYNSSVYYENPNYIFECYKQKKML